MSWPTFTITLRLRLLVALSAAVGMIAVQLAVGALFPSVGHKIGELKIPSSVAGLLGGANYATISGWFGSEIGSVYGPLVIGAVAIIAASATTAGEEENGQLTLILAYPITRRRLVASKAAAVAALVLGVAAGSWLGMICGVALGGGGISTAHVTAWALQLVCFGWALGALTLAIATGTGRRPPATAAAAAVAIAGWLINSFAPLVTGLGWLRYLSFYYYYYYADDPLSRGVAPVHAAVLAVAALALTTAATLAINRRDLRG